MEGDQQRVCRPFRSAIPVSDLYDAQFERLETRVIPQLDRDEPAAVVWLAHTPYSGSIAPRLRVRGLRARAGNIQVGSDCVFEHLFHEARFNGWCIGEVHVVDKRILPNGRRDYFEPSPHLRNLENHLGAIAHEICLRCRSASSQRNKIRTLHSDIEGIKNAQQLIESGFLLNEDAICMLNHQRNKLLQIKETIAQLTNTLAQVDLPDLDSCLQQMEANVPQLDLVLEGRTATSGICATISFWSHCK